jgi:hypothetical protein
MSFCLCNTYTFTPSGGLAAGGAATATDTIIRGGATLGGSALVDVPSQPFDAYAAVWPLTETGTGAVGEFEDRSPFQRHGQGGGGVASLVPGTEAGLICRDCQAFEGREHIATPDLEITSAHAMTVSVWVRLDRLYRARTLYQSRWLTLMVNQAGSPMADVVLGDGTSLRAYGTAIGQRDRWYHFACVWQPGTGLAVYVDGTEVGSTSTTEATLTASALSGRIGSGQTGSHHLGNLQELRVRPEAMSAAWLAAEHDLWCGSLVTVGDEIEGLVG